MLTVYCLAKAYRYLRPDSLANPTGNKSSGFRDDNKKKARDVSIMLKVGKDRDGQALIWTVNHWRRVYYRQNPI
jgi:hypothetical protein